ncbi:MAG TPA: hypothetical protein VI685_13505 [Candidatus Angelobacter sp.]
MILIITQSIDPHAEFVIAALKRRHAQYVRVDTDSPPAQSPKTLRFSNGWSASAHNQDGEKVDFEDIRVIWNRRHSKPTRYAEMSADDERFAYREYKHFLSGLWHMLRDRFWINQVQATEAAENKPNQLAIAQSLGLEIPRTLMTNDPAEAFSFWEECDGRIIYKTFHPTIRWNSDGRALAVYTTPVQKADLISRGDDICLTPCIFQEYVEKQTELRITVVGTRIFAAEINTRNSTRARDDWRRYDYKNTIYRPYTLPESVSDLLHKLMKRLNLVFGCIDMVVTPDNRFVFLEINPMGEWLWIERNTELPLLAHFTEMLIQGSETYPEPAQPLALSSVMEKA